jgi:ATP-dependent RNA helicase RhlE
LGFLPQLRKILRVMKKPPQTLMFSATMDPQVESVAREFLTEPARLRIGETATPPAAIRQTIFPVLQESKAAMLLHLQRRDGVAPTIVFARTRSRADRVAKLLLRNLVNTVVIHGGRTQNQGNAALAGFRNGQYAVLVATDVAARGLDRARSIWRRSNYRASYCGGPDGLRQGSVAANATRRA